MEEIKDKVIVLRSVPSKEKDKIVTLFSLNKGVIKASLKGVLNPNAKLKFMAQPFCFAEATLLQRNGLYTIINAYPIETFYALSNDFDKFLAGSSVLEILNTFSLNENSYPDVFVSALKTFKLLEFEDSNPKLALIKFMLEVFKYAGYGFILDKCSECGSQILTEPYFDLDSGNILCLACKNQFCIHVSKPVLVNLNIISNENIDKLATIKVNSDVLTSILELLKKAYKAKFNVVLKSF